VYPLDPLEIDPLKTNSELFDPQISSSHLQRSSLDPAMQWSLDSPKHSHFTVKWLWLHERK
jgi:hypothetical protein